MKKIFFSFLAIAAIASCAKTEAVYEAGEAEIKLAPVTKLQTKANFLGAVDGIVYPTQENFDVYAYWKNVPAGQEFTDGSLFLAGENAGGAEFTNKGNYWGGTVNYYWPKNGSLRFAAYSPAHLDVDHVLANDVYSTTYVQPSKTAETWDFLVAPTSTSYSLMTATEKVAIEFQHALSWITLKVVAKDADAAKAFDIKKVTINDVNTKADFNASMLDGIQFDEWSGWDDKADYVVYEGSQMVTETLTDIENTVAGTILIPQATTSVTINFDQYGINGTADTPGMTVTLDLLLDNEDAQGRNVWEPGKHYNYNLVFGLDEILINPSVADWTEVEVGELDVDASNVSTSAQFVAAVAKGGKITLQANVELDQAVTVAKDVVLELNGYTLSYTSDATAHNAMITVNTGAELIVRDCERNGKGKISYEYTGAGDSNFGWGSYTIANNGELYVENGTVEIVCACNENSVTHMYSAIHQGGNANSTTVVSGGKVINNNYRSIRVNQGSLKIYDGVEVAGQVWMQPFATTTSLEIVGGNFQPTGADGSSVFVTNNQYPVQVLVRGGNFATKIGASDATAAGVKGSIIAGTFADVTGLNENLIAEGYSLAQQGSVWSVVEGDYDVVAENFDDLYAAVADGKNVIFASDFTATSTGSNGYGKTGLSQTKGGVIDGNGNDFACPSANGTWDSAISTTGGTIKNINVVEGFRGIFIKKGTEKVYLENVKIDGTTYTISCDQASYQGLEARNCTFNGWTSFAATLGEVYFLDCSFGAGNGYKFCRPYAPTTFEGCDFCEGYAIDARAKVSFVNCTFNGVALTEANIATLVTGNRQNVESVR